MVVGGVPLGHFLLAQILKALAGGVPQYELLEDYPELEQEDIQAVLLYAAERIGEERVFLVDAGN